MNPKTKTILLALLAVLFWSSAATAFKLTLQSLDFISIVTIASFVSFIIFLSVGLSRGKLKNITGSELLKSAFLGFLNPFAYYLILLKAYSLIPAQQAQPLNFIWPLMIVLLSVPILKQKLRLLDFVALLISFFGVIIISTRGDFSKFTVSNPLGIILASSSSLIWALYFLINVRDKRSDIRKLTLNFFFGFIFTITLFIILGKPIPQFNFGVWGSIYIGIFEMGITFLIWIKALRIIERKSFVNNIIFLTPFVSLLFIRFILKEHIHISAILGLIIITIGITSQKKWKNIKT